MICLVIYIITQKKWKSQPMYQFEILGWNAGGNHKMLLDRHQFHFTEVMSRKSIQKSSQRYFLFQARRGGGQEEAHERRLWMWQQEVEVVDSHGFYFNFL